ncbi:hypothetical protein ACSBR2_042815 [Camellia fascicularis]
MCLNSFMELLPGLPNDVALECLIRIPFDQFSVASSVCRGWKAEIELPEFRRHRKLSGLAQSVIALARARVDPVRKTHLSKHLARLVYRIVLCDPETGYWSELPPVPGFPDGLPMFCHLVGVGSELVLIGGCDPVTWEVSKSVFIYNFVSGTWRRGADMPGGHRLFFGCASDFDRTVYVAGGHDDEKNALKSAMMYDVAKDEWILLNDMAKERDECKAVFHRGKFYVISGYRTNAQGRFERDAEAFDLTTQQWDPVQEDFLEDAMCPRTCVDGSDARKLYMCRNGNVMVCKNATWEVQAGLPAEVCNAAYVTTWQGKLLVIGSAKIGEPHRAYVMDLKNCKWTKLESPEEYSGHVQTGCCLEI